MHDAFFFFAVKIFAWLGLSHTTIEYCCTLYLVYRSFYMAVVTLSLIATNLKVAFVRTYEHPLGSCYDKYARPRLPTSALAVRELTLDNHGKCEYDTKSTSIGKNTDTTHQTTIGVNLRTKSLQM